MDIYWVIDVALYAEEEAPHPPSHPEGHHRGRDRLQGLSGQNRRVQGDDRQKYIFRDSEHHPLDISSDEDALTRSRTETEKLKLLRVDNLGVPFELQKETSEENRLISEFTSLNVNFEPDTNLDELIQKMQKRVGFYSDKEAKTGDALEKLYKHFHSSTVEGRVSVDKASSNSEVLYEKIIETRKSYKELRGKLVDNSLKIT